MCEGGMCIEWGGWVGSKDIIEEDCARECG
jgi:hypothetical protein